ncbi:MAG: hypothetical protein ACRBFS_24300 [Aureispira sp.]
MNEIRRQLSELPIDELHKLINALKMGKSAFIEAAENPYFWRAHHVPELAYALNLNYEAMVQLICEEVNKLSNSSKTA